MIEEDIYNFLISDTEFTSLVDSDSLGYISVENSASYPKVTFNIISRPRIVYGSDEWQRWRFFIVSDNRFECREIADVLTDMFNGSYGTFGSSTIDYIQKLDEYIVELDDRGLYQLSIDFRIKYH